MQANIDETRNEAIAELKSALSELESGEELSRFVGGHGIMSRLFEFTWSEPALEINFRLPYARALADEESQKEDDAEICAALRMAQLLLMVENLKDTNSEGLHARVWADESGVGYSISDKDGNDVDFGDDWSGLVHRLEAVLPEGAEQLSIIWP